MKNDYRFKQWAALTVLMLLPLLLLACGAANPPVNAPTVSSEQLPATSTDVAAPVEESYPPPAAVAQPADAYPSGAEAAAPEPTLEPGSYPPAQTEEAFREPRFRFDLPLQTGATTVSGQAPPDIALAIADITFNGAILGSGRSDADGRFSISVSPLPDGHRIGVTVAELQPGQTIADMSTAYYPHRGDGFMNLPNLGVFFETAMVAP